MDFKQKAEEKKMSMSKNIARLAVTAGLTAALSFGGVMAPVTMAFADGGAPGSITINKVAEDNKDNTFKAYQIFKAKVVDEKDTGKVASDIEWANNTIGSKVTTAITESAEYKALVKKDPTRGLKKGASASDVAEWLSQNVTGTTAGTANNIGTRVAPGDVLYSIAKAVAEDGEAAGSSFKAGEQWTRPSTNGDGYYLFASDSLTNPAKPNTGTSPIFALVGGDPVTVTEKTSIPTVDKQILDDTADKTAATPAEGDWKNVGDAWIGQVIDYRLTGTVADNITSYDKYQYEFHDTLSKGLNVVKDANGNPLNLKVYIVKKDGTHAEVKYDASKGYTATATRDPDSKTELLKVSFDNLKAIEDTTNASIAAGDIRNVVVTYQATLTSDAEYTATGNTNDVKLVYSNNPMADGTGTSTSKRVTDHVFRLDVTKVEKDNQDQKLEATFQVKMTQEGDTPLKTNRWLTQTGGITEKKEDAGKFTTEKDTGKIYIPGLVEGTYEITECNTPAGYNTLAPFTITVKPEYGNGGNLTKLTVTSSDTVMVTPGNTKDATIPVTIQNKKGSGLPLTGLNGVTFTWIAGGAVLCIGVAHLIRSRKQAEESEQE